MKILFTDEFLIQYNIIKRLALNGNIDFSNLAKQISLCIKVMHEADNDTAPVLKKHLRPHKGAKKEGYLAPPNDKCISIDLDGEHRLVAYRNGNEAIIISSICHYDTVEKKLLFNDLDSIAKRIKKELSTGGLDLFDPASLVIKEEILLSVKDTDSSAYEIDFNNNICPSSPNVYIHNLKRCIKTSVEDNSYYGQETSKEGINSTIREFFRNNHDFLERTIVNARCFNNVASVVCGNGDLKETALLKLELQENLLKNIADVFAFVDDSSLSWNDKGEIFGGLKSTVLNAFNDSHDRIIYGTNESSPEYVLAKAIDKSFQNKINNDSNLQSKNNRISKESLFEFENKDISDKKIKVKGSSPEIFFVFAKNLWNNFLPSKLWNTFFPSKKKKNNDDSAIPENKNVKQEENIIKTETIAESQENQSLNNQVQSLSLERRKYMNNRIQLKPEASNEETQKSDRMKMMQSNKERNNACDNVISTSQKKGRSR